MPSKQSSRPPQTKISFSHVWLTGLSGILLAIVLFFVVRIGGYVEGEEFSPTHFRSREFSFYEIPILHLQITPIRRTSTTPPTALMITQKKWIVPPSSPPQQWHLVSISHGMEDTREDDAALLMQQFRFHRDGRPVWKTWSDTHPKQASVLWPMIAKLSQRELYILMPRLLELVRGCDDVATLQATVGSYLQEQYASLVRDMEAAGHPELAAELSTEAAQDLILTR